MPVLAAVLALLVTALVLGVPSARHPSAAVARTRHPLVAPATTTTVAPLVTTTTVDPGALPQTRALPSDTDPVFEAGVADLWQAVTSGDPAVAMPFFFPLSAYLQVKAESNPAADWQDRLVAHFEADIDTLHARLGPGAASARFESISVPESAAAWVLPGTEYNKGSYYRVYGTVVHYTVDGEQGSFTIDSMISWRGEWYVVHLLSFA